MPNTSRRGWANSPPPSHDPHMIWPQQPQPPAPSMYSIPHDLGMMLGRIFERTEATAARTERMEDRLTEIGERLIKSDSRFEAIEATVETHIAAKPTAPAPPPAATGFWPSVAPHLPSIIKTLSGTVVLSAVAAAVAAGKLSSGDAKDIALRVIGK